MGQLKIKNFAQIDNAEITFSDMTVLVGPQATGKSLVLQLLKFALDAPSIAFRLRQAGITWESASHSLLSTYLGEGYDQAFSPTTSITYDRVDLLKERSRAINRHSRVFFVPAQRVLTVANGWPRAFSEYGPGNPYVVKEFSQEVLSQFGRGLGGKSGALFPQSDRIKRPIRESIERSVFHGGALFLKKDGARQQLMLRYKPRDGRSSRGVELPFLEWSAGQREFTPLLLGLYQLLPAGRLPKHSEYRWAVIEEPEMGLHPQAINSVMLLAFELLNRGYRVVLSTHSPYILEMLWALRTLKKSSSARAVNALLEAICLPSSMRDFGVDLLKKRVSVYALSMDKEMKHQCTDISSLDLESSSGIAAGWGGVTSFSTIVSRAVARGL